MINQDRARFTDPSIKDKIKTMENSKEVQDRLASVKEEMKSRTFSILNYRWVFMIGIFIFFFLITDFEYKVIFNLVIIFGAWFLSSFFRKNREQNENAYVDNFLLPVLKEIFPETEIDYSKGLKIKVLENFLPNQEGFYGNCHIRFGDEFRTEFSNFLAYHYTTDSDGDTRKVTDFVGQGLFIKMPTNINGHIRIVPTTRKSVFGNKKHGIYGKRRKDEMEIETESIDFNESYSIFSTDDFYTRLILDPKIIDLLNSWEDRMDVVVYMNEEYISIAFKSNEYIFEIPTTKQGVDDLSLSSEYEKVREKLVDFYSLIDIVRAKL